MSRPTVVLASGNAHKLTELSQLLGQFMVVHPQDTYDVPEVAETASTFVENAILKARNACLHTGLPAIADDSGLEVDALQGAPGVFSARFAGEDASDQRNNEKLLERLGDVKGSARSATFRCAIVLLRSDSDPTPVICMGSWQGRILEQPQGLRGFGYDPLFYLPQFDCSVAQLAPRIKNEHSHRAQAISSLLKVLSCELVLGA